MVHLRFGGLAPVPDSYNIMAKYLTNEVLTVLSNTITAIEHDQFPVMITDLSVRHRPHDPMGA